MAKNKSRRGLHKEITSIFDGVPLPKSDGHNQPRQAPATDRKVPNLPSQPEPAKERYEAPVAPKAATMPAQVSTKPEIRQPVPMSQPKPVEKSRADVVVIEASVGTSPLDRIRAFFSDKLSSQGLGSDTGNQKKMIILIPVLIVVFVIVFSRLFSGPTGTVPTPPKGPTGGGIVMSTEINWEIPDMYPEKLRNPMQVAAVRRPPVNGNGGGGENPTLPVAIPVLEMRGILWVADDPTVLIGTEILHVGDEIDGAKIITINQKSIVFEIDGKKYEQTGNEVKSVD